MATTAMGISLLDAVRQIEPVIRANAAQSERERRLSDETVAALKGIGLYRMCKPRIYGGMELDAETAIRVGEELARVDAAAAWNVMISTTGLSFSAWLPDEGLEEFLGGDPDKILSGAVFLRARRFRWMVVTG